MQTLISGVPQHLEVRRNWSLKRNIQEDKRKIRREGDPGSQTKNVFKEERLINQGSKVKLAIIPCQGIRGYSYIFSSNISSSLGGSGEKEKEYLHFFKLPLTPVCLFRVLNLYLHSDTYVHCPILLPHHYTGDLLGHPLPLVHQLQAACVAD